MKHVACFFWLTLVLMSCGTDSRHFKLDGRLLHLNQGEFYVYSPDGLIDGMDTIKVTGGRFTYEIPCEKSGTLLIVFPNFSEHPVFAVPGKKVEVKGDASHLKELEVKGTDDNELMSMFNKRIANASPPEVLKYVEQFVNDHPTSDVGRYLVCKYFLRTPKPNYPKAKQLVGVMVKKQPKNGALSRLQRQFSGGYVAEGDRLPSFSVTDVNGNVVTSAALSKAPLAVINVWTSWSYESLDIQRQLNQFQKHHAARLKVVGLSIDPSKKACKETLKRDSIRWSNICDEALFEGGLVRQLGISSIPYNIILKNGRVVACGLDAQALMKKLEELI